MWRSVKYLKDYWSDLEDNLAWWSKMSLGERSLKLEKLRKNLKRRVMGQFIYFKIVIAFWKLGYSYNDRKLKYWNYW